MKLTSNAMSRLSLHQAMGFNLGSFIFEPEHFKDCVVLTKEEAQTIQELLEYVYYNCSDPELEQKSLSLFRNIKSCLKGINYEAK